MGSEVRRLKWADINWSSERFTVHSPKTARYAGHESRVVPMFAELATLFTERYEEAKEGDEYVLPMLIGKTDAAIRKPLVQAIKRAGVKQWPRLWHNMRSTRQTELSDSHPSHVVCAWLGNSKLVAEKHYLQVTEDHFKQAVKKVVQNAVQESGVLEGHRENQDSQNPLFSSVVNSTAPMAVLSNSPGGTTDNALNTTLQALSKTGDVNSDAILTSSPFETEVASLLNLDDDLQTVLSHWHNLSDETKRTILSLIRLTLGLV